MALINFAHRDITAKVVYAGARKAGCNTNLKGLFERVRSTEKSNLHGFGPDFEDEKTLFFAYTPEGTAPVTGFSTRIRVYSMPGGLSHPLHRAEILRDTDALVFVADARRGRDQSNVDAFVELERCLAEQGIDMATLPVVIQVNHCDDEHAEPPDRVVYDLNPYDFPVIKAVAQQGEGVLETHARLVSDTTQRIRESLSGSGGSVVLNAVHRPERDSDEELVKQHIEAIARARTETPSPRSESPIPRGEDYVLAFQPPEFAGMRPVDLQGAHLEGDRIVLEIVMDRLRGDAPRLLPLILENRPGDVEPLPMMLTSSHKPPPSLEFSPTASLPDKVELPSRKPASSNSEKEVQIAERALWVGLAGLTGGLLAGLLIGYLFWY